MLTAGSSKAPFGASLTEAWAERAASVSQTVFADSQLLMKASCLVFSSVSELLRGLHFSGWEATPSSTKLCNLSILQPKLPVSFRGFMRGEEAGSAGRLLERSALAATCSGAALGELFPAKSGQGSSTGKSAQWGHCSSVPSVPPTVITRLSSDVSEHIQDNDCSD